jgi:uncharacterized membrane protein HdeD (DUF308 family)
MVWSGSSPLAVVRDGMWGFLMIAAVAWLTIAWSVLRLEPTDIVSVAGPVVLFGALTEALRACAGTQTWWLNAGMAVLFAVTGVVLLAEQDSSYTTPAALIGWYLMVRGAADVAVSMMTRDSDRIWGLLMVVGVLETGLGFFAASPLSRTADLVVVILGGLGLLRGVADLVTALRVRELHAARANVLELPPERAAGLAGYSAGMSDYAAAPVRSKARHRATSRSSASWSANEKSPAASGPNGSAPTEAAAAGGAAGGMSAAGYTAADSSEDSFHDEVLRTTADLDAMLALAGVTGAGVGAHLGDLEMPEVPDTPEGAEAREAATSADAPRSMAEASHAGDDRGLPFLDPAARAAHGATAEMDDTAIIAGSRRLD